MSVKVRNSLSTFLDQAIALEKNNLETISQINNAVLTSEDSITLTLTDPSDTSKTQTYYIPSFGYLKSSIERLENSINTMSNLDAGAGSRIRLSDGSFRKIVASKVPSEAPTITTVNNITNFNFRSNWFFEDMLNPMLYVTWDFSNQISSDTERVMIQRYIIECDTAKKIELFEQNLEGRSDIDYKKFLYFIIQNKLRYTLDDEIKDLPPRNKRYTGNFSIINIKSDTDIVKSSTVKRYVFSDIKYTDNRAGIENTKILALGDYLEVNANPITTRYKVVYVDEATNEVSLQCVEGFDPIKLGKDVLRISSSQDTNVSAEIPVSYNERQVVFVKAIDPDSNIPAAKWSPGVAFNTNKLTYEDGNGKVYTLQKFYQKNVVDFGQVLLSYSEDYYPSIREGIKPNAPDLYYDSGEGNFRIIQINKQLTEDVDNATFRSLVRDKESSKQQIETLSKQIDKQKAVIQTTNYVSTNEKLAAQNTLDALVSSYETEVSRYNGIVGNIKAKYTSGNIVTPKYRVRGYWDIPAEQVSPSSDIQKIIKFKIRYRYLSSTGVANKEEEFTYYSGGTELKGRYSNWNEIETKLRPRVKTSTGWEWATIRTDDPDEININQLDIPIQAGEQVEIQIKSVSEAGFPANPMESDWCDPIVVAFSDFPELEADDVTELIEQNNVDSAITSISRSLSIVNSHMNTSFYTNDKYFSHTAETITSGFLSPEQTPITLYDKLRDLQTQIEVLTEQINQISGNLIIKLIDASDEEQVHTLTEGGTTYIYAGNYMTDVEKLDKSKRNGAIITKRYYIDITSDNTSGLYLMSKITGNRLSMCPSSLSGNVSALDSNFVFAGGETEPNYYELYDNVTTPSTTSSLYYKTKGRYDLVPINLSNSDTIDFQLASPSMYQSAQCKGQFVYSRFRDVGDTFNMYANKTYTCCSGTWGVFDEASPFINSEIRFNKDKYTFGDTTVKNNVCAATCVSTSIQYRAERYGVSKSKTAVRTKEIETYKTLSGSPSLCVSTVRDSDLENAYGILYRLPKTWAKPQTSSKTLLSDAKVVTRLTSLTNKLCVATNNVDLTSNIKMAQTLRNRAASVITQSNGGNSYTVEPKLQAAYGFSDLGKILKVDLDGSGSADDGSYLTTHKIGYEETDRFCVGEDTCNSYVFLSPSNHAEIQVDGDTYRSSKGISSTESVRVPIIFQYRMTDYNGNIFGKASNKSSDATVKNTKFANIIGIDIWRDTATDEPLQFDIVFYSDYTSNSTVSDTTIRKPSSQVLVDTAKDLSNNLAKLKNESTATPQVNSRINSSKRLNR